MKLELTPNEVQVVTGILGGYIADNENDERLTDEVKSARSVFTKLLDKGDRKMKDEERNSQEAYKELCENYSSNKSLYTDGFSDGYKECQKEHEWHYVKDGDLPKKNKEYVVKVKEYGGISVYIGRYWKKEKMFTGSYLEELDVIKWKEIE